jgi:hypothetical protein
MNRANYEVVEDFPPSPLIIRDIGPWNRYQSVTNAAETVVEELYACGALSDIRRLLYYDSEGNLDELLHREGRFAGFRPGPYRRTVHGR